MLKEKILRYKVMDVHRSLVKEGKLLEARELLRLLRKGHLKLGLDDVSWEVENLCKKLGCKIFYNARGYTADIRLPLKGGQNGKE